MLLKIVTSLGRSGLQDWLLQRISAIILSLYTVGILGFWLFHWDANYEPWHNLFTRNYMRYANLAALLSLLVHSWIGMWVISTDYLKKIWLRLPIQLLIFVLLGVYLIWGIQILWA